MSDEHFKFIYLTIIRAFDDKTATQYLRDDGEGGFAAGVYRMAREIERLRAKCGEPAERDRSWELEEDMRIYAEIAELDWLRFSA